MTHCRAKYSSTVPLTTVTGIDGLLLRISLPSHRWLEAREFNSSLPSGMRRWPASECIVQRKIILNPRRERYTKLTANLQLKTCHNRTMTRRKSPGSYLTNILLSIVSPNVIELSFPCPQRPQPYTMCTLLDHSFRDWQQKCAWLTFDLLITNLWIISIGVIQSILTLSDLTWSRSWQRSRRTLSECSPSSSLKNKLCYQISLEPLLVVKKKLQQLQIYRYL